MAQRLVEEAATRQVIVFTHDIVLLHDLLDRATESGVPVHLQRVYHSADGFGTVTDELPWKTQNTLQRIDYLEKKQREAAQCQQAGDDDRYEKMVSDIYTELRATIERAIEECLFNRVVVRHRDYINMRQLAKVGVLDGSDCTFLLTLYKRCCDITQAHDPSTGRNRSAPTPMMSQRTSAEFAELGASLAGTAKVDCMTVRVISQYAGTCQPVVSFAQDLWSIQSASSVSRSGDEPRPARRSGRGRPRMSMMHLASVMRLFSEPRALRS